MINSILKRAADKYGIEHQSIVAVEEFAELTKELSKYYRGMHNVDSIAEEICDCEIMIEQLKYLYDCELEVELNRRFKIDRLEGRLNEEK